MNLFVETLHFIVLLFYYVLEAIVLFFIPARYRMKDVKGQIVLITGAGTGANVMCSTITMKNLHSKTDKHTVSLI